MVELHCQCMLLEEAEESFIEVNSLLLLQNVDALTTLFNPADSWLSKL